MKKRLEKLKAAVLASLKGQNILLTASGAAVAYILLVIFTFPTYMYQLLGKSFYYFPEVIRASSIGVFDNSGFLGISLTVTYALLTGVLLTNIYLNLKSQSFSGILDIGAFLPGFLVAGCASCGVGFLTLLGFSGVVAALPFSGNLLLAGGILLMVWLLQRTGNPETCSI